MIPVLFQIGFLKIYTFGIFLVLAFFWGSFYLWKNIRLTSFKEEEIFDGLFVAITSSLLISRLFYIFFHFSEFGFNPERFIFINGYPGLSFVGALMGGIGGLIMFMHVKKIALRDALDYFAGPLFLAIFFGSLGSFFAGNVVGIHTRLPFGIYLPGHVGLRHPTALYTALLFLVGLFIAHRLMYRVRREMHKKGIVFMFFVWYSSLVLVLLDFLTENKEHMWGRGVDFSVLAFLLLTFSIYFIYYFRNRFIGNIGRLRSVNVFRKHNDKKYEQKMGGEITQTGSNNKNTD